MSEATVSLKLRGFMVPNYVTVEMPIGRRQDGIQEAPKFSLCDLDTETLNRMCDDFRVAVHKRAAEQRKERSGALDAT